MKIVNDTNNEVNVPVTLIVKYDSKKHMKMLYPCPNIKLNI